MDSIISFAPATIANVGPCFDIMGYALNHAGDFAEVSKVDGPQENILWDGLAGPHAEALSEVPYQSNAAYVAANDIWMKIRNNLDYGLKLRLHKYMDTGTGLGSSACSGVAAAHAVLSITGAALAPQQLIASLIMGEAAACGSAHADNVAPSFFGGLQLLTIRPYNPLPGGEVRYQAIAGGSSLVSVIAQPIVSIGTKESRQALIGHIRNRYGRPEQFDPADLLDMVREQSIKAADLVVAWQADDIRRVGAIMRSNPLLEAARSKFIPHFDEVKQAALQAGASGCTIAGSGPSVVAVTDDYSQAEAIREAMLTAFKKVRARWLISRVNQKGATVIDSIPDFVKEARHFTDMME